MIIQIISAEKGKQCDFYPFGSIHDVVKTDKGIKPSKGRGVGMGANFEYKELKDLPPMSQMKLCPYCEILFDKEAPFVESNQTGDRDMCLRCYEKKYVVGREEYKEALTKEILQSLKLKTTE